MTILLENESKINIDINYQKIANEVIEAVLDYVNCPYECEINILLTDNDKIKEINKQVRHIDSPTDVLSFPFVDFQKEADFSIVENDICSYFNANSGELLLGDIMISLERAVEQAKEYNHSIIREYAFLIAHSMLHLSGFDHMNDLERTNMEKIQSEILQGIGYTRDMRE